MVMQCNSSLNQTLEKLFFVSDRFPPNVFPNFVGIVEMLLVKEFDSTQVTLRIHDQILTEPLF